MTDHKNKVFSEIYSLPSRLTEDEMVKEGIEKFKKDYPILGDIDESKFDWLIGLDGDDFARDCKSIRLEVKV